MTDSTTENDSDPYIEQNSLGDDDTSDGDTTTSASTRHKYTNDVLAGALIGAQVVLLGLALAVGAAVPDLVWTAFIAEGLLAATWAFGRGAAGKLLESISG